MDAAWAIFQSVSNILQKAGLDGGEEIDGITGFLQAVCVVVTK